MDLDRVCLTLIREAPDAIVYADAEGVIRLWNRGAERVFGSAEAEAVGSRLDIIIPESLRARHWQGYKATMRTGNTRYGAGEIPRRAGNAKGREAHLDRVHDPPVPRRGRWDDRDCGDPFNDHLYAVNNRYSRLLAACNVSALNSSAFHSSSLISGSSTWSTPSRPTTLGKERVTP